MTYTPEPMEDEPPIPPQRAAIFDYASTVPSHVHVALSYMYPRGYGPSGTQGPSRLFAVAITGDEAGPSYQPQPPSKPPPPGRPTQPPVIPIVPSRSAWAARFLLEMYQLTVVINVSGLSVDTSAYIGYFRSTTWSISQHRNPDQIM